MRVHRVSFLLLAISVGLCLAYPSAQIHEKFSREQLRRVFNVDDYERVPDYRVVRIESSRRKRDAPSADKVVHVTAFGQNYKLRLEKNEHLAKSARRLKVLLADVKDGRLRLREDSPSDDRSSSEDVGDAYHDVQNEAALTLRDDGNGGLRMEGTIGKNLVIKPLPTSLSNEIDETLVEHPTPTPFESSADDEMFLDEDYATDKNSTAVRRDEDASATKEGRDASMHVVYLRKRAEDDGGSDFLFMEPDRSPAGSTRGRKRREAPDTIWPEVLVIADYDTYNMHGANSINIKRYFVSFWNGVDLRYKLLTGPRVRISLAGIIISKGRDATPYLENNRVKGDAVDSAAALTDMGKYLFRERRLPTYDLAVVVTKLDLCRKQFHSGNCNTGTAGFAYVGGACVVNSRLEKVNSVAIVEDTGGFSGIIVAAHEVGHLLGAVHDGSPAPNYLGGPGAEHCRWEDGYIMSDLRHTERGFQWSTCTIQQFRHFLNDTATCLHNVPHEDEELPRILPGRMLSLDAQCRKDRGTSACFKDDRVCAQLFCFDSKSGYCVSYRPAAEGSPCGDGQFCINGRCLYEHDNFIPDYTKITETIVEQPDTAATNPKPAFARPGVGGPDDDDGVPVVTVLPVTPPRRRISRTTTQVLGNIPRKENGAQCEDVMTTLAGGLTCKDFLRKFGDRYCSHHYLISNCCLSRQLLCVK